MTVTYRRIDPDSYEASDGTNAVVVQRVWYRLGGWQWEVSTVREGLAGTRAPTRKDAAERALRRLAAQTERQSS